MLPPPNSTRGLDFRQALAWLILTYGPPSPMEASHALLPKTLWGWACLIAATAFLHFLVTKAASHPASNVLDSQGRSQTPALYASLTPEESCETPTDLTKTPLVRQEDNSLTVHPKGRGGYMGVSQQHFGKKFFFRSFSSFLLRKRDWVLVFRYLPLLCFSEWAVL